MTAASPGVVRRWVFPILRILVFAAIGVALVKLAFFNGATSGSDQIVPTGAVSDPVTTVHTGSIHNDVSLSATVFPDAAVPVRASVTGEITKVSATAGQHVDGGTALVTIKQTIESTGTVTKNQTTTDPDTGEVTTTPITEPAPPVIKYVVVPAGAAGTLSSLTALVGQEVAVGDVLAQVAPPTFNVSGTIAAVDQYRLLSKPTEAQVTISGGPEPFTCTGLTISAPLAGSTGGAGDSSAPAGDTSADSSGSPATGGPTVRCAVPADTTVFAGLAAKVKISAGSADDALLVPATAVEGAGAAGTVYLPGADGAAPTPAKVQLGIFDGTSVQIVSGLKKGDEILEFVPSKSDEQHAAQAGFGG
ncbi:efflux RND transporter periplasmic adaptor subunit [Gryllotalpicola protaetiae]|uniref:Efflux RND transporter periplasmic adaptor subunit n=1 Tax=Gryllotalpicola protaetiae TaxID=2419771 RepID=A0A387C0Y8_9MICO|nr:efflux RND transporter periplasmic adaptor subunit [Gryllotalpicola protaetiae]AYG04191.1 efflux RND transporter periplasmic adaptor subunit [Gryllotalpicola protaetiae]